jgi:Tfp pilus assembly protein PilF
LDHFDSANHYFNLTLGLDPKHHGARHDRAMLLMRHGKPAEALDEIENALTISPDSALYLGVRGWVLMELERFDEAERQLKEALSMDPDVIHAQINLARVYDKTGRHRHALREIDAVLERPVLPTGLRPTLQKIRSDILEKTAAADTTG